MTIFVPSAADLSPRWACRRANRFGMNTLIDAGNQVLFPGKPFDLPDTERNQRGNHRHHEAADHRQLGGSMLSLCFFGGNAGHDQKPLRAA